MYGRIHDVGRWCYFSQVDLGTGFGFKPQPISDQSMRLGFPHCAGRHRPAGSLFSSVICCKLREVQGCMIRRSELLLAGQREALALFWRQANQPSVGVIGVSTQSGTVSIWGISVCVPKLS